MLVELIRINDTGHVEGLSSAYKGPEGTAVGLSNDVCWNTVASSIPASRELTTDNAVELERLGNENARTLLELNKPLATLTSPNVALVAVLILELLRLDLRSFEGLEVVDKLDLLVEDFLVGVVAAEQLRF